MWPKERAGLRESMVSMAVKLYTGSCEAVVRNLGLWSPWEIAVVGTGEEIVKTSSGPYLKYRRTQLMLGWLLLLVCYFSPLLIFLGTRHFFVGLWDPHFIYHCLTSTEVRVSCFLPLS